MIFSLTPPLLELLILSIVDQEDSYGYQISQRIRPVSGLKDSALYPVLKRLSENRCIEAYDRQYQGRNRKYYRMTEQGRGYYQMLAREWQAYQEQIARIIEGGGNPEHEQGTVHETAETETASSSEGGI